MNFHAKKNKSIKEIVDMSLHNYFFIAPNTNQVERWIRKVGKRKYELLLLLLPCLRTVLHIFWSILFSLLLQQYLRLLQENTLSPGCSRTLLHSVLSTLYCVFDDFFCTGSLFLVNKHNKIFISSQKNPDGPVFLFPRFSNSCSFLPALYYQSSLLHLVPLPLDH